MPAVKAVFSSERKKSAGFTILMALLTLVSGNSVMNINIVINTQWKLCSEKALVKSRQVT